MPSPSAPPAARRPRGIKARTTTLVVTGNDRLRTAVCRHLEDQGMRVVTAQTAKEAIACIDRQMIDIVIADIDDPRLGYNDLHKNIHSAYPHIRRIAVVRELTISLALGSFRTGSIGVISDPFDRVEFDRLVALALATIRSWMRRMDSLAHKPAPGKTAS